MAAEDCVPPSATSCPTGDGWQNTRRINWLMISLMMKEYNWPTIQNEKPFPCRDSDFTKDSEIENNN